MLGRDLVLLFRFDLVGLRRGVNALFFGQSEAEEVGRPGSMIVGLNGNPLFESKVDYEPDRFVGPIGKITIFAPRGVLDILSVVSGGWGCRPGMEKSPSER